MKIPYFFPDKWEFSPDFPKKPNFPMFVPKTNEISQFGDNFPKSGSADHFSGLHNITHKFVSFIT